MGAEELSWSHGTLLDLPTEECWRLVAGRSVGRVAWTGPDGPTVLPVNFAVADDEVWFRVNAHSSFSREIDDLRVAFEVDDVDEFTRSGWSVLLRGTARVVYDVDRLPRTWPGTETWPAGSVCSPGRVRRHPAAPHLARHRDLAGGIARPPRRHRGGPGVRSPVAGQLMVLSVPVPYLG